jgi:hypothetical protein
MAIAQEFVQPLHEPLSTTSRHLAEAAAPLALGAIPVVGIPLNQAPPAALSGLSVPAMSAAPALSRNAVPVAPAAAAVAPAVPVLARAAPI